MAGARGQGRLERSRAIAAALGSAVMTLYFFVAIGLLFWVALLLPDHPEELELIAILFITMSAVLGAALATALLYKLMGGQTPSHASGGGVLGGYQEVRLDSSSHRCRIRVFPDCFQNYRGFGDFLINFGSDYYLQNS